MAAASGEGDANRAPAIRDYDPERGFQTPAETGRGRVLVWRIFLDRLAWSPEPLLGLLAEDERDRAARMTSAAGRREYVVVRALLRMLLGERLGIAPESVRFSIGPMGKPSLSLGTPGPPLECGVSHSHALALLAVAAGGEVGVDVERERRGLRAEAVARRFFSVSEARIVRQREGAARREAFYRLWTRKEAYMKARGRGLARAFPRFTVSADASPRLIADEEDGGAPAEWGLADIPVPRPYRAACAWKRVGGEPGAESTGRK